MTTLGIIAGVWAFIEIVDKASDIQQKVQKRSVGTPKDNIIFAKRKYDLFSKIRRSNKVYSDNAIETVRTHSHEELDERTKQQLFV
jgi:hypothetical protein